MINYYKDHIPRRSDLLTPLTTLTKKGARFKWTDDCQHIFDELKRLLTKQTVLAYPNFAIPFEIYTDASNKQIGSVIQQNRRPPWHSTVTNLPTLRLATQLLNWNSLPLLKLSKSIALSSWSHYQDLYGSQEPYLCKLQY
jgi:hypothetical protein